MDNGFSVEFLGNPDDQTKRIPSLGEIGLNNFAPYIMNRIMARWNANLAEDMKARDVTTVKMRALAVLNVSSSLTINELSVFAVTVVGDAPHIGCDESFALSTPASFTPAGPRRGSTRRSPHPA